MLTELSQPMRSMGYTLIELLIVIFIISIVSGVALLRIGHNENKRIATFANDLTQTIQLAEERAMLQPAVLGLNFKENFFQFEIYDVENNKKAWLIFDDAILNKRKIPIDIQVSVKIDNMREHLADNQSTQPQIIISTNGEVTPFTLYIGKKGNKASYKIVGEADGTISVLSIS